MMALNLLKLNPIKRIGLLSSIQSVNLSTVKIKLDGKPISIDELPKKPRSLNLFQNYCAELGVSGNELKDQREQLLKSFKANKSTYLEKNKQLVDSYRGELKAYREIYKKTIKLRDVQDLINFCNKTITKQAAKQASKKPRKLSFYNFFIKFGFEKGLGKDMKELSAKYQNLSASEMEHYKNLYENYLRLN